MRTKFFSFAGFSALACIFCFAGCTTDSSSDPGKITISYNHPLATSGHAVIFVDGNPYPFNDIFDYSEYYAGNDLKEEFEYYLNKGYKSFLNIDLNGDSGYFQLYIPNWGPSPGVYE